MKAFQKKKKKNNKEKTSARKRRRAAAAQGGKERVVRKGVDGRGRAENAKTSVGAKEVERNQFLGGKPGSGRERGRGNWGKKKPPEKDWNKAWTNSTTTRKRRKIRSTIDRVTRSKGGQKMREQRGKGQGGPKQGAPQKAGKADGNRLTPTIPPTRGEMKKESKNEIAGRWPRQ